MPHKLDKRGKQIRGFNAMPRKQRSEIASKGGKASHGGGRPPSKPKEPAR